MKKDRSKKNEPRIRNMLDQGVKDGVHVLKNFGPQNNKKEKPEPSPEVPIFKIEV